MNEAQRDTGSDLFEALTRFGEALRQLRIRRAKERLRRRYDRQPTDVSRRRDRRIMGEQDEE